jgi:hypothetical protein
VAVTETTANADVVAVRAVEAVDGTWTFHVTVAHPDTGWEDYADGWDVVLPDGTVIRPDAGSPFTRLLLHPHETEQPFTRSQAGIVIPEDVTTVTVRAHDLVDGFGGVKWWLISRLLMARILSSSDLSNPVNAIDLIIGRARCAVSAPVVKG